MNILVIGSEGFIGSNIVAYYVARGFRVTGVDNKIAAGNGAYRYLQVLSFNYALDHMLDERPDVCIFAAGSASVQLSISQPDLDFEANVLAVSRILASLLKLNPACKFIHISSAAVYGNPASLPVAENAVAKPLSPYGWHKLQAEVLCREYHDCYQLPTCSIRPFSVYGKGQRKLLFWDLYHKFLSKGAAVELFGSGHESRDFIYISDFLDALDLIVSRGSFDACVYNMGSGTETTIRDAAYTMRQVMGSAKDITFTMQERAGDPGCWKADIASLQALGFKPSVGLDTGLQHYYQWINENA